MKKIILSANLFCLLLLGCKDAKTDVIEPAVSQVTSQESRSYPQLYFDKIEHDFGDMIQGEEKTTVFEFKNTGEAPLQIVSINAKCGCTVPNDWPRKALAPGETGQFTVKFNSRSKEGRIKQPITIKSNTRSGEDEVTITATVGV